MLKIYTILYRTAIIIVLGLYILLMIAASSGGYGNSDPDTIEIMYLVCMVAVFISLTLFQNVKGKVAKNIYKYVSLFLVAVLFISFSVVMANAELSPFMLVIFVLFGIISILLSYALIRFKAPE